MVGFSERKDDMRRKKKFGWVAIQHWVCHFEALREEKKSQNCIRVREPWSITRTRCRASFWVNYSEFFSKYIIKEFKLEHNYSLVFYKKSISFVHIKKLVMQTLRKQRYEEMLM